MVTNQPSPRPPRRRRATPGKPVRPAVHAAVFAAVADPTRRAILDSLRAGGRPAGRIAADFAVSRPAVSKHLRVLTQARLVRVIRQGRNRMYELDPAPLREIEAWIEGYRTFWAAKLIAIKRLVEDETLDSTGDAP